ncbi:class I SAM-dependent methyltransferase [Hoyosella rhizosphaerae]|nr:class I SAM-dependent methyltransferase [Hoyosella rhizosphaerae]MBN4926374.1 class I SAM-dependent methyltransferase [Hoyosella rhizosphaerae]
MTLARSAPLLRTAFERHEYNSDTLVTVLGPAGLAALDRGEPAPIRRACRNAGHLGTLISLFILGDPVPVAEAAEALAPLSVDGATESGYIRVDGDEVTALWDIRPLDTGNGTRWMISDHDGSLRPRTVRPDHVLGVGAASLSLLRATPTEPVQTVLDIGTGCGVQALHAATYAQDVTATDISERSLMVTAAASALNDIPIDLLHGSWFEPVSGRTFDQIVANPPFVVSGPSVELTYRDSGLELDGASEIMVRESLEHLNPGGTAILLASWIHQSGHDWRSRVASWLPDHGVDAWFVQRDIADLELYVSTWLRDADVDLRTAAGQARQEQWREALHDQNVDAIGFGFVYLRHTNSPSDILCEDLTQAFEDPLGDEALAYFQRVAWLRDHDVLNATYQLNPAVVLEKVLTPGSEGWQPYVTRIHRGDGPRWQHEIDDLGAMVLAGVRPDGLPLNELLELAAAAVGEDSKAIVEHGVQLAQGLIRHGILIPSDVLGDLATETPGTSPA